MATLQDVIRNILIRGKTEGVTETTADLNALAGAQGGVAVATDKTERSTLSLQTRIESLRKSVDAEYRAEIQLARIHKDLAAARAQGIITATQANDLATKAAAKYNTEGEAATKAAEGLKLLKEVSLGFVGGLGAGVLLGGIAELPTAIAEAVDRMGKTANVAETIGITTKALQELRFAASQSDVEVGTLDQAMTKFSTNMAKNGSPLQKLFSVNGASITGDPLKDLERFADLVKNASNQEERNAIVTAGMGKSAAEMGRLFSEGSVGIAKWAHEAENAGIMTDDELQRARELGDEMKRLTPELQNAQNEFALLIVPSEIVALTTFNEGLHQTRDLLTDIANLNFSGLLSKLGEFGLAVSAGPGGFIAHMQADAIQRQAVNSITVHGGATEGASGPTKLPPAAGSGAAENSYKKLIESTDKRILQLKDEKDALTQAGLAADTLRAYTELLNQAEATGVKLSPERIAKLHEEADALAKAKEALAGGQLNQSDATPVDTFGATFGKLNGMLKDGAISWQTYGVEVGKAAEKMTNEYGDAANNVIDNLSSITDALAGQGREAFEIHKALSIAKAVVSGGEAIVHSYTAGAAVGGPVVGAIFAGIAAAATAAQIASIAATSYSSTTASSPAASSGSAVGGVAAASAPQQGITFQIHGSGTVGVDDIVNQIVQQARDGGYSDLVQVMRAA